MRQAPTRRRRVVCTVSADERWRGILDALEQAVRTPVSASRILAGDSTALPAQGSRADGEWEPPTDVGALPVALADRAARILALIDERGAETRALLSRVAEHRDALESLARPTAPAPRYLDLTG